MKLLRWLISLSMLLPLIGVAKDNYVQLAGTPPPCTSLAFKAWLDDLVAARLNQNPVARARDYYFSAATGSDERGDGSEGNPWRTLQKAQAVIDAATNGNVCLRFRQGEVWRAESGEGKVVLSANIVETYGYSVRLDPKPQWKVLNDFQFELRGGSSNELVSTVKASAYDPVSGWLTLQTMPKPEHTQIYAECALLVSQPNITLSSYGAPLGVDLPRFTRFIHTGGNWRNAAARGDAFASVYSWHDNIPATGEVAWVYFNTPAVQLYKSVTGPAEVNAYPQMWFWDAGQRAIYAHYQTGVALDTPAVSGEYVMDNHWNGIIVSDVDGTRIDNLRVDGWGLCAQPAGNAAQQAYAGYGIIGFCTQNNVLAVTGCECYFNNRHNIGNVARLDQAGGILVAKDCRVGLCVEGSSLVSYAPLGGNECLVVGCRGVSSRLLWGPKPYANDRAVSGSLHSAHTSGGANTIGLFVSYGNEIAAGREMMSFGSPVNLPEWERVDDCRVFFVDDTFNARQPTSLDELHPFKDTSTIGLCMPEALGKGAYLNCWFEHRILWSSGTQNAPTIYAPTPGACLLNCVFTLDAIGFDYTAGARYTCWGLDQVRASHSQFHIQEYSPAAYAGLSKQAWYSSVAATNTLLNCVLSCAGIEYDGEGLRQGGFMPGNANDARFIQNNAYAPGDYRDGTGGYANDPWAVTLAEWIPGTYPEASSPLCSAHDQLVDGHRLEYDFDWRPRDVAQPAIGPFEPLSRGAYSHIPTLQGSLTNGFFEVKFFGVSGYSYQLQTSTNLKTWSAWGQVQGAGAWIRLSDPAATQKYYRVAVSAE